jgi:hypothetical protein
MDQVEERIARAAGDLSLDVQAWGQRIAAQFQQAGLLPPQNSVVAAQPPLVAAPTIPQHQRPAAVGREVTANANNRAFGAEPSGADVRLAMIQARLHCISQAVVARRGEDAQRPRMRVERDFEQRRPQPGDGANERIVGAAMNPIVAVDDDDGDEMDEKW